MLDVYLVFIFGFLILLGFGLVYIYFHEKRLKFYKKRSKIVFDKNSMPGALSSSLKIADKHATKSDHVANSNINPNINSSLAISYAPAKQENLEKNSIPNIGFRKNQLDAAKHFLKNNLQVKNAIHDLECLQMQLAFEMGVAHSAQEMFYLIDAMRENSSLKIDIRYMDAQQTELKNLSPQQLLRLFYLRAYLFKSFTYQNIALKTDAFFAYQASLADLMTYLEFSHIMQHSQRLAILLEANIDAPNMQEKIASIEGLAYAYPWLMQAIHHQLCFLHTTPLSAILNIFDLMPEIFKLNNPNNPNNPNNLNNLNNIDDWYWTCDSWNNKNINKNINNVAEKQQASLVFYLKNNNIQTNHAPFYIVVKTNDLKAIEQLSKIDFTENIQNHQNHQNNLWLNLSKAIKSLDILLDEIHFFIQPYAIISQKTSLENTSSMSSITLATTLLNIFLQEILTHFEGVIKHVSSKININKNTNENINENINGLKELADFSIKNIEQHLQETSRKNCIAKITDYLKNYQSSLVIDLVAKDLIDIKNDKQIINFYQEDIFHQLLIEGKIPTFEAENINALNNNDLFYQQLIHPFININININ